MERGNVMEFNSLSELKQRIMPALKMKEERFKNEGKNITAEDIWIYLINNKWMKSKNLSLNEIVNDILKLENID